MPLTHLVVRRRIHADNAGEPLNQLARQLCRYGAHLGAVGSSEAGSTIAREREVTIRDIRAGYRKNYTDGLNDEWVSRRRAKYRKYGPATFHCYDDARSLLFALSHSTPTPKRNHAVCGRRLTIVWYPIWRCESRRDRHDIAKTAASDDQATVSRACGGAGDRAPLCWR